MINIYILYRNSIRSLTRASKKLFYQSSFNQNLSNMKKTWESIRELIGRQKKYCKSISAVGANSSSPLVNDPSKIANNMNFHFATRGHHLAAKLPHSEKHFSDYLTPRNDAGSFMFRPIEPEEIITEILTLSSNKSYGLYSYLIRLLNCSRQILGETLAIIFNTSIESGIFPTKLKIAKLIPIFKAGDATAPSNYRPISLLSIFNKIFEKPIYKRLNSYIISKKIISESQYGFHEKHSTEHAILDIIRKIKANMDKKLYSCGVFIDLSKAFDTVDHDILHDKLHSLWD